MAIFYDVVLVTRYFEKKTCFTFTWDYVGNHVGAKVIFCRNIIYLPKLYYYIKTNSRTHIYILLLMWVKDYKMLYPHRKFCFLTCEQHLSDYFHYISLWRMIVGIQDKEHWPSYLPRDVEATSRLESSHRIAHCYKVIRIMYF